MTDPVAENALTAVLGDLVSVNHRLTRVAARAAGSGESPAIWRTLSALSTNGPIRLGELAELSRVSQPTATKLVNGLVARGWAERRPDERDARAIRIGITAEGSAALVQWRSQLATALLPLFVDLSESETDTIARAVEILRARVDLQELITKKEAARRE